MNDEQIKIPKLTDLIVDWVTTKDLPVVVSLPDPYDHSVYIDAKGGTHWIADVLNTNCKVVLRDSYQSICGELKPEDPEFFDKLEAHIINRLEEIKNG